MLEGRYDGRESSRELNSALYSEVMDFISAIENDLANSGYEISIAGSLAVGKAIYESGGSWYIKDIDFRLTKSGGDLNWEEADQLRKNPWFFQTVKGFLRHLAGFYREHEIKNGINEADFIYKKSGFIPGTFAIGVNS